MNKGKIIVFEGLDCSFKETNSFKLYQYLKNLGLKTYWKSFPCYEDESSYFVRQYLKGIYGKTEDINPIIGSSFYMIDQYHVWKTELKELYNDGYIIILDRFWTSNLYHQVSKIKESDYNGERVDYIKDASNIVEKIIDLATIDYKLPIPDLVLYMKVDLYNIIRLLKEKNKNKTGDLHEDNFEYLQNVYKLYHSGIINNSKRLKSRNIYCSYINNRNDFLLYDIENLARILNDLINKSINIHTPTDHLKLLSEDKFKDVCFPTDYFKLLSEDETFLSVLEASKDVIKYDDFRNIVS